MGVATESRIAVHVFFFFVVSHFVQLMHFLFGKHLGADSDHEIALSPGHLPQIERLVSKQNGRIEEGRGVS